MLTCRSQRYQQAEGNGDYTDYAHLVQTLNIAKTPDEV